MNNKINKRGWLLVVEAVIAVLILFGFVFASIAKQTEDRKAFEEKPSLYETANLLTKMAREDDQIRRFVLSNPPNEGLALVKLQTQANSMNLNVDLSVKICPVSEICLSNLIGEGKDIYSSDTIISSGQSGQESKRLKVFVWQK